MHGYKYWFNCTSFYYFPVKLALPCFLVHVSFNHCFFFLQETLTGFKWMGNLASELMAQGKTVLFSFEEAIGALIYL